MKQKKTIRCPYCGSTAILRDASFVYGDRSYGGKVYVCSHYPACNAYVGVHPVQTATFRGQQGRISRPVKAILSGRL